MENILKLIGKFIGEKFALLDTIYLKRSEALKPKGTTATSINGYVEILPPRPAIGDRYILMPKVKNLYIGIYFLNFGRTGSKTFKIVGDANAIAAADGANCFASLAGNGAKTGHIPITPNQELKIYTGVASYKDRATMTNTVQEYDLNGTLINSSVCTISAANPQPFIPLANTAAISVHITGTGKIRYIKIWQAAGSPDKQKIYRWDGIAWQTDPIPQGTMLTVKGKTFGLIGEFQRTRQVSLVTIPELPIAVGKMVSTSNIRLTQTLQNDNYIVRIFVKRRRFCKKLNGKLANQTKYYESIKYRVHNPSAKNVWYQDPRIKLSREIINGEQTNILPYTWFDLVQIVFTKASRITKKEGGLAGFVTNKYYPSTGLYCRNKRKRQNQPDYADFAICLSKKVEGKWINGEKTYLRISQCARTDMHTYVMVNNLI